MKYPPVPSGKFGSTPPLAPMSPPPPGPSPGWHGLMEATSNLGFGGTGSDVTIRELTERVARATGYAGRVSWDATKPDGTPRKLLDVSRMTALGWQARIGLGEGIPAAYRSFLAELKSGRLRT